MNDCEIFYEIKKLNEEIEILEEKFRETKQRVVDKVIKQIGQDEFNENVKELSKLVHSENEANKTKKITLISSIFLIIVPMILVAVFISIILALIGCGVIGYLLLFKFNYPEVKQVKKLKKSVNEFLNAHKTYYGIVLKEYGTIGVTVAGMPLKKYIRDARNIDFYNKKNIFYRSSISSIKNEDYEKKEEFVLNNKKYSKLFKQQISEAEDKLLEAKKRRENKANENKLIVDFVASKVFVNLIIEIFETNKNIKTKLDALQFIVEKIKENINCDNGFEKLTEFDDVVTAIKKKFAMTFIPNFF